MVYVTARLKNRVTSLTWPHLTIDAETTSVVSFTPSDLFLISQESPATNSNKVTNFNVVGSVKRITLGKTPGYRWVPYTHWFSCSHLFKFNSVLPPEEISNPEYSQSRYLQKKVAWKDNTENMWASPECSSTFEFNLSHLVLHAFQLYHPLTQRTWVNVCHRDFLLPWNDPTRTWSPHKNDNEL